MTVYRELIERQLAVRQAGLQIGLQKANEQEPFIAAVAETLSRTMWGYAMRMDALTVESDRMPYGMAACRVVFGEVR